MGHAGRCCRRWIFLECHKHFRAKEDKNKVELYSTISTVDMADMSLERYYIIYVFSYLAPFIGLITMSPDPLQYGHRELPATSNSFNRLVTVLSRWHCMAHSKPHMRDNKPGTFSPVTRLMLLWRVLRECYKKWQLWCCMLRLQHWDTGESKWWFRIKCSYIFIVGKPKREWEKTRVPAPDHRRAVPDTYRLPAVSI